MADYLYDKEGEDPEVAELERALGGYAHRAPLRQLAPRRRHGRAATFIAVAAVAAAVVALLAWPDSPTPPDTAPSELAHSDPSRAAPTCESEAQGFAFATNGGAAQCGAAPARAGVLPVGTWLETSANVSATVEVADIGALEMHGDSRLRLVGTGPDEHRLELARGRVSAQVVAPPRLFVVDTPSGSAVDLGCAYDLAVDEHDQTHLRVTLGEVSLEGEGLIAWVPMGNEVLARPGRGPGLPVAFGAKAPFRAAAARFSAGDVSALPGLVGRAGDRDVGTLWNLLLRTEGEQRALVFARLNALRPRPSSVEERDILAGDRKAIEAWRDALDATGLE